MSTLIALGGNFSQATSWALAHPSGEWDSEISSRNVTTSYISGSGFVPVTNLTIDAIALKPKGISGFGTITASLQSGVPDVLIPGTEVTLDFGTGIGTSGPDYGWLLFRFTGNQILVGNVSYRVQAKASAANMITLYSSGDTSANSINWARQIRTTTTQLPSTGDKLIIAGEFSGQLGSGKGVNITMDFNASGSTGIGSIWISKSGSLNWSTGLNTYLSITGSVIDTARRGIEVCESGIMNIGQSGVPISSGVSAIVQFDCTSNVAFGLEIRNGAFVNMWGE